MRQAERPLPQSTEAMSFPSFRAIHADVLKGMISYRIGFLECAHGRASNGQHARKGLFNDSFSPCQVLIRANPPAWYFPPNLTRNRRFRRPEPNRAPVSRQASLRDGQF